MGEGVVVPAADHPMVKAAAARLASVGAWQRILHGDPLAEGVDRVDAELLVAAGLLADRAGGRYALIATGPQYRDPQIVASDAMVTLRQALRHARGGEPGWRGEDPDIVLAQGRSSRVAAGWIAETILPALPGAHRAFESGAGRFLDVGVGVAAISIGLVQRFPGLTAVGLDVLPQVLDLARGEIAAHGVAERVEVRSESVAELAEQDVYDLAWLPQPFIPPGPFAAGVGAVFRALKPGGAVSVPLAVAGDEASAFRRAELVHAAHLAGGGPTTVAEVRDLLVSAGFVSVAEHRLAGQVVLSAGKP